MKLYPDSIRALAAVLLPSRREKCPCPVCGEPQPRAALGPHLNLEHDAGEVAREARKPCRGVNANVCVAEGCYGEACVKEAAR